MPFSARESLSTSIAKGRKGPHDAIRRHEGHQSLPLSARVGGHPPYPRSNSANSSSSLWPASSDSARCSRNTASASAFRAGSV